MRQYLCQTLANPWAAFTPGQQFTVGRHQCLQTDTFEERFDTCMGLERTQGLPQAHRGRSILNQNTAQLVLIDAGHLQYLRGLTRVDGGMLRP
ncbi:hypothetical protein D3C81_834170 [compost metagenome]